MTHNHTTLKHQLLIRFAYVLSVPPPFILTHVCQSIHLIFILTFSLKCTFKFFSLCCYHWNSCKIFQQSSNTLWRKNFLILNIQVVSRFYFVDNRPCTYKCNKQGDKREGRTEHLISVGAFIWASVPSGPQGHDDPQKSPEAGLCLRNVTVVDTHACQSDIIYCASLKNGIHILKYLLE